MSFVDGIATENQINYYENLRVMFTKNKVQLIGRLGNAPEIKNLENGKKLAKFSLATNESYTNQKGEKVDETTWHNIVAWGKMADVCENTLNKGNEVSIEGKINYRDYTDTNGIKRYMTEIQAFEVSLVEKKAAV